MKLCSTVVGCLAQLAACCCGILEPSIKDGPEAHGLLSQSVGSHVSAEKAIKLPSGASSSCAQLGCHHRIPVLRHECMEWRHDLDRAM
mmetsp:Transcript_24608/g.47961  ORF Transcript_24608/g.47961 Transcript_24608/m.47961 type:complete len:88 (+) Transcript_24608:921-1184(+)